MWQGAMTLFYEMHERGIRIDTQTYTAVARALKEGRQWQTAIRFLGGQQGAGRQATGGRGG